MSSSSQTKESTWDLTDAEVDTFLGLLYLRGVINAKNFPVDLLWSDEYGCQALRQVMPRNRFREKSSSDLTADAHAVNA